MFIFPVKNFPRISVTSSKVSADVPVINTYNEHPQLGNSIFPK